MKERHTTIIYLVKNEVTQLDKQNQTYAKVFDFIREKMVKPALNLMNKSIIGWQQKEFLSNKLIFEFLFEVLTRLNSTRGRLQECEKYEELTSISSFVYQKSFESLFGFKLDCKSKYKSEEIFYLLFL